MLFVFGWGKQKVTDFGPIEDKFCWKCNSMQPWHAVRISQMFSAMFIPLFPFENHYFVLCRRCNFGHECQKGEWDPMRRKAELNVLLSQGKISQADYDEQVDALGDAASLVLKSF